MSTESLTRPFPDPRARGPLVFAADLDQTLIRPQRETHLGDDELGVLTGRIVQEKKVRKLEHEHHQQPNYFAPGINTGNMWPHVMKLAQAEHNPDLAYFMAESDFAVTAVGTAIHYRQIQDGRELWVPDEEWPNVEGWDGEAIRQLISGELHMNKLWPQEDDRQSEFKLSFMAEHLGVAQDLELLLRAEQVPGDVIFSTMTDGEPGFLDVFPNGTGKGPAMRRVAQKYAAERGGNPLCVAAGDSENDASQARAADWMLVPGNVRHSLREIIRNEGLGGKTIFAQSERATGILEGLEALGAISSAA